MILISTDESNQNYNNMLYIIFTMTDVRDHNNVIEFNCETGLFYIPFAALC